MLNSDKLNTVSYKKGCYTGQEVIARTHYLGNVKKHTYLAVVDACIDTEVNIVNKDGESVGELIGETFKYNDRILSHCILRDSSDFKDLCISNKNLQVITQEDIVLTISLSLMSSASDIFINSAKLESIFTFSIIEYDSLVIFIGKRTSGWRQYYIHLRTLRRLLRSHQSHFQEYLCDHIWLTLLMLHLIILYIQLSPLLF